MNIPRKSARSGKRTLEERFFLSGPGRRLAELIRAVRIFLEFLRGFRKLHFVGPCVTVFGSARFPEDHVYYELARQVGGQLAAAGFTVMTGGGPGIMEAANRGAQEAGGRSIGCNIELPEEQGSQPVSGPVGGVQPLLCPQGDAGQILLCLRGAAGWFWNPGRDI